MYIPRLWCAPLEKGYIKDLNSFYFKISRELPKRGDAKEVKQPEKPRAVIVVSFFKRRHGDSAGHTGAGRDQSKGEEDSQLLSRENGFVSSMIEAYCGHHHLNPPPRSYLVRDPHAV